MSPQRDHHHQEHVQPGEDLTDRAQGRKEHRAGLRQASHTLPSPARRHGEFNIIFSQSKQDKILPILYQYQIVKLIPCL